MESGAGPGLGLSGGSVEWRPLLYVAGAAAAVGSICYFSRRKRQPRNRGDKQAQTDNEAPVATVTLHAAPVAPSPPPLKSQLNSVSSSQSAPEAAGDTSPQSRPTSPPQAAPSPPQPAPEPQLSPSLASESAPEATGYSTSPQSEPIVTLQAPPVAPSPPPLESQLNSSQSATEAAGDMPGSTSPKSQTALSSQDPPLAPSPPQSAPETQPLLDATSQSVAGVTADLPFPPEAYEVPAFYNYFAMKRMSNFGLKLSALRQAFTIVLSNSHHLKYMTIAGKILLGGLAARNARTVPGFRQAYDQLAAYAQNPSNYEEICAELTQIGIQHFNFIDVVYELVLMGLLQGVRSPIFPRPGGFLELLMETIFSVSPVTTEGTPHAEQYLFLLQDEAMLLLDDLFAGEEHTYVNPASLALTVWGCLEKHVQQLLLRVQAA